MYRKDTTVKDEDLVLTETQKLEEKCGECNGQLVLKVFWTKDGYKQRIECEKCEIGLWRTIKKRE